MSKSTTTTPPAFEFKGLDDWFEVLKAGTWTDSKNNTVTFSAADLKQMADNATKLGKVPSVIGHPKANDPAYAWNELKAEGDVLYAKSSDINPEFAAAVDSGAYRNRSIKVFQDPEYGWRPDHIGWLGAQRPAIPLRALEYQAHEGVVAHEFSAALEFSGGWDDFDIAYGFERLAETMRGLREWLIDEKGLDAADKVLPSYQVDGLRSTAERIKKNAEEEMRREREEEAGAPSAFSAPKTEGATVPKTYTQAEVDALLASKTAEFSAPATELMTLKTQIRDDKIAAQITAWMSPDASGRAKLLPADKPGLAEFMAHLDTATGTPVELAFSAPGADGKDAPKKAKPYDWFVEFMGRRTGGLRLGRLEHTDPPPKADATDVDAITAAANEFMASEAKAGRTVTFSVAVSHVKAQAGA